MTAFLNSCRAEKEGVRIGVISPGEMGVSIVRVLLSRGHQVFSTTEGRSARTVALAESSGACLVPSLSDLVRTVDVVFSTVTPGTAVAAATDVAAACGRHAINSENNRLIYVDANSVSPQTAAAVAEIVDTAGMRFVDCAIHGLASRLTTQGTIYFSGAEATAVRQLFGTDVRTCDLGTTPGQASSMKMLLGGMSKGIVAQFVQSGLLAEAHGVTEEFCTELGRYFPDVLSFLQRSLPTYTTHAARRAQEMRELKETLLQEGFNAGMASAAEDIFESITVANGAGAADGLRQPIEISELINAVTPTDSEAQSHPALSTAR